MLNKLEQRLGRPPEVDEIADELEVEPGDMELLMRLAQRPVSLEMPCDDSEPDRTYGDLIPDDNVPCSDEVFLTSS